MCAEGKEFTWKGVCKEQKLEQTNKKIEKKKKKKKITGDVIDDNDSGHRINFGEEILCHGRIHKNGDNAATTTIW